jgi:synaptobrevin family protein YKT6
MPAVVEPANIKLVAVVNSHKQIVASLDGSRETREEKQAHRQMLDQVLLSDNFDREALPLARRTLTGDGFKLHFMCDGSRRVYVCLAASEYPTRIVFQMLAELETSVTSSFTDEQLGEQKLGSKGKAVLKELAKRYEDPAKADSLTRVQAQIEVVTATALSATQTVVANTAVIEGIEGKSENLNAAADQFRRQGRRIKNQQWRKKWCMYVVAAAVAVVVVAAVGLLIAYEADGGSAPTLAPTPAPAPPLAPDLALAPTPTPAPAPSGRYLRGA